MENTARFWSMAWTPNSMKTWGNGRLEPIKAWYHFWDLHVKGRHTKTTDSWGHAVGVSKKK
jgi:hypothetical protein